MNLLTPFRLHAASPLAPVRVYARSRSARRVDCTNALLVLPLVQFLRSAGTLLARWGRALLRESGLAVHWRFVALLVLISFLTAWLGTRALMAGFEDTWTEVALSAARHENQALRTRQDSLREQTAAALARLEALDTRYARTP